MAVRLPVIMIQSPPGGGRWPSLGESILGELIGRPGIDLTLVGRLGELTAASTDRLTLESLRGDLAVLDWQPPGEILADWHRLGLDGIRAPHPDDETPTPVLPPNRRIYAFDLRGYEDAGLVCDAVKRLLESRQTRTFTLGGIGNGKPPVAPQSPRPTRPPSRPKSDEHRSSPHTIHDGQGAPRRPCKEESTSESTPHRDRELDRERELEALVDELDLLDP